MLKCPKCRSALQGEISRSPATVQCLSCGRSLRVDIFPALYREASSGDSGDTFLLDDEAGCFYHPKKKAATSCSSCGRFLCALCDVELHGRHLCTSCLETSKKERKIETLENHRTLYDNIALGLAFYPILFFWVTVLTAPLVLFIAIRYWKAPSSIIGRTKARLIVALLISSLQLVGWFGFVYSRVAG